MCYNFPASKGNNLWKWLNFYSKQSFQGGSCHKMHLVLTSLFFGTLFKSAWNCFLTSHNCLSTSQDTVNSTFQNRCLQFIGFAGHFVSPACAMCMQCASASPRLNKVLISTVLQLFPSLRVLEGITRKYSWQQTYCKPTICNQWWFHNFRLKPPQQCLAAKT